MRAPRRGPERATARAPTTPPTSPSALTSPSTPRFPAAPRRTSSTPSRCCTAWRTESDRNLAGASSSTAAATLRLTPHGPSRRLGAAEPVIVYRRNRERMPAHPTELAEAEQEGIAFRWLTTIAGVEHGKIKIERMELTSGLPATDRRIRRARRRLGRARARTGRRPRAAESLDGVEIRDHMVAVDEQMMTGHAGSSPAATWSPRNGWRPSPSATGGVRAARCIDGWLRDAPAGPEPVVELASYDVINPWYYNDAPRTVRPQLEEIRRQTTFEEVVQGLDESSALFEARRCLSCGNCFSCDNCFGVCPDNAVLKPGPRRRAVRVRPPITARAAGCVSRSAHAVRSRWSRRRARDDPPARTR